MIYELGAIELQRTLVFISSPHQQCMLGTYMYAFFALVCFLRLKVICWRMFLHQCVIDAFLYGPIFILQVI